MGEGIIDSLGWKVAVKTMARARIGHGLNKPPGLLRQTREKLVQTIWVIVSIGVAALDQDRRAGRIIQGKPWNHIIGPDDRVIGHMGTEGRCLMAADRVCGGAQQGDDAAPREPHNPNEVGIDLGLSSEEGLGGKGIVKGF